MKLVPILILGLLSSASCFASTKRITIYYLPWSIAKSHDMSKESVRQNAYVKEEIRNSDYCEDILRLLDASSKQSVIGGEGVCDLRLVGEVEQEDGEIEECIANRFNLLDVKRHRMRSLDDHFRSAISDYLHPRR